MVVSYSGQDVYLALSGELLDKDAGTAIMGHVAPERCTAKQ